MSNQLFEELYKKQIYSKYGDLRNEKIDSILFNDSILPNEYDQIIDQYRINLHHLDIITIDPEGCEDADDAFSLYEDDNKLFLVIHIADPTYYINNNSELWYNILNRGISHYPSNNKPIHMMPYDIIKRASLMVSDNIKEETKKAISITFEIDTKTFLPTKNIRLDFTEIIVRDTGKLTYYQAGNLLKTNNILEVCSKISNNVKKERSKKTIGTKLSELDIMIPSFENGNIKLVENNKNEKLMKEMIGEFAILTNSFIGEYIKKNINGLGIFRTCQASFSTDIEQHISGEEILNRIINEGIKAEYSSNESSHDLVGMPIYCHFTSPMRRVSDCICHFLIKAYITNKNYQWTSEELKHISQSCYHITKKEKSIQYNDQKFRIFQLLHNLIEHNIIQIKFRIIGYSGLFLNCSINRIIINNKSYMVQLSYTLRKRNLKYETNIDDHTLIITKINPLEEYDEGKLIELDEYVYNLFS